MDSSRIATLLAPFVNKESLSANRLSQLSAYLDLLLRWNARMNLTAVRDPEEIVTRHFGESLFTATYLSEVSGSLADLGSGAGFPGLPIKIWSPALEVTLIEANQKKATFLREVIRSLSLTRVNVNQGRAETLPPESFEILTLRAVERFETALPIAIQLLKPGGTLALLIGETQAETARSVAKTIRWSHMLPLPGSQARVLLLGAKNQGS